MHNISALDLLEDDKQTKCNSKKLKSLACIKE